MLRQSHVRLVPRVLAATLGLSLAACPPADPPANATADALAGAPTVYTQADGNPPGKAQIYRVTNATTGPVDRLNVFLHASNTASVVGIGLYASRSARRAGALLARCGVYATVPNAWNRCTIPAVNLTAGTTYWLAILQPTGATGTLRYVANLSAAGGQSFGSASSTLSSLRYADPWVNGEDWGPQMASVYADFAGAAPSDAGPGTTDTGAVPTDAGTGAMDSGTDTGGPASDTAAPTAPTGLVASAVTATGFTLGWSAATDNVGVTGYQVFRNGTAVGTTAGTSLAVTGLSASTMYAMTVKARDAAGNWSAASAALGVTTAAAPSTGACAVATPNVPDGPDPFGGCFPGPATTGVPAGTTLTTYTGPCTITTAGTVIDAKIVNCDLNIRALNVTIRNSRVNGSIRTDDGSVPHSLTVTDTEIDAGDVTATTNDGKSGIIGTDFVATRIETFRGIRGVWCEARCTVQDSWIHGQDRDEGGRAHESGIRMGDGSRIIHNTVRCDAPDVAPDAGCSADLTGYGDFAPIRNNLIQRNLFLATTGGACAYGGSSGGKPYSNDAANIVFRENVFQRRSEYQSSGKCGYWFAITDFDTSAPGNVWDNNRWDTGELVPPG